MIGAAVAWACLALPPWAAGQPAPPPGDPPSPELRPYAIRAWLTVDPGARLAPGDRDRLVADWIELTGRFVGEPWAIEPVDDPGPLLGLRPDDLTAEQVAGAVEGADKGWFLHVGGADEGGGWVLSGREFDARTRRLGPPYRQSAPYRRDAPRALYLLCRRVFAPVAEVVRAPGGATLRVQGAALPVADPAGAVVAPGAVFRPYWVFLEPDRAVRGIREIPHTYLRARQVRGGTVDCDVISGLRRPLPKQVSGLYELVALGTRPSSRPTRFEFLARRPGDQKLVPVPGAVLQTRAYPDGTVREVGTTGRDGTISLPADYSDGLVIVRLLAGGVEPLREIPVLPGETDEVLTLPVEPRPLAVALEYRLKAIQDDLVDLIARRGRLEARLASRAEGMAWDEVKTLLDEFAQLPAQSTFRGRVEQLRAEATRQQAEEKVAILTPTVLAQLAEVEALILRYLDDAAFTAYADAYRRHLEAAAADATPPGRSAPSPSPPASAPASAPPP